MLPEQKYGRACPGEWQQVTLSMLSGLWRGWVPASPLLVEGVFVCEADDESRGGNLMTAYPPVAQRDNDLPIIRQIQISTSVFASEEDDDVA